MSGAGSRVGEPGYRERSPGALWRAEAAPHLGGTGRGAATTPSPWALRWARASSTRPPGWSRLGHPGRRSGSGTPPPRLCAPMFGPALRSSFPVAPPAAQFPGDCFPATARVGRSCPPHPPPAPARPRLWFWCGSGACLWLQRRGRLGAGRQRHGTHGLRGRRHPGWATSLLWASVPGPVKRGREPGFKAEPRVSPSCKPGPCGPDRVWGANAAMDSLAAPQDRLVEQLLSPRTQAQRRLKVCVERGAECGSVCVRPPGPGPQGSGT